VSEALDGCMDQAAKMVAGRALSQWFILDSIFVCAECVGDIVGCEEVHVIQGLPQ